MNSQFLTIALASIAVVSHALLFAYWRISRRTNAAHLEILCRSDEARRTRSNAASDLRPWKRLELTQMILGLTFLALLLTWGAIQINYAAVETTLDQVFVWSFAAAYVGLVLVAEHFKLEDLSHSMGFGKRAQRRLEQQLA